MITTNNYLLDTKGDASYLKNLTLGDVFEATVATEGDKPAVYKDGEWLSWNHWSDEAMALARGLQELGVKAGDVVALHLPNCWEFLTLHIAVAKIGAVAFPLHMAYGEHELRVLLQRTNAIALVLPETYLKYNLLETGKRLHAELPDLQHLIIVEPKQDSEVISTDDLIAKWQGTSPSPVSVKPEDPLILLASSGTTSLRPKICMHSHDGLLSNVAATTADGKAQAEDIIISASPFTHLFGLLSLHMSLFARCKQALLAGWKTENFFELAQGAGANVAFAVPAQLRDACIYLDKNAGNYNVNFREVRTGGAGVPAILVDDVRRFMGANVIVQWGMSEVGAGICTRPEYPVESATRSIGKPVSGAEAKILNDDGEQLGTDEVGSLWYRSPYMFKGYLGDLEITNSAVSSEGWLLTGDLASLNDDGTIAYRGRRTELINRGGLKFSAVEVESLLVDLASLNQFAIISKPDPRLGERSCLVASIREGYTLSLEDVVAHLSAKGLAKYKWPEELILVDSLPSTPTGKIARVRLSDLIKAKTDQQHQNII